jgi:hypothetical protein
MEKPKLIPQIYGYLVCLVTVITFLISLTTLVNALIDRTDPMYANSSYMAEKSSNLASFEIYKADLMKSTKGETDATKSSYVPDDKTLRAMYETARAEKIRSELHQINRTIIVDCFLIVICFILFLTHWRWMRKLNN